eukprot:12454231-Alexandrium_andersonii.AAC.1
MVHAAPAAVAAAPAAGAPAQQQGASPAVDLEQTGSGDPCFLGLFAGSGGLTAAVRRAGALVAVPQDLRAAGG